jgi:hypothetical protein
MEDTMSQTDTLERTAIVAYTLLTELHHALVDPDNPDPGSSDEVTLGIILGTAMFCDEKVGPFRAKRLMQNAPDIVLREDAHVTDDGAALCVPVLQAFCKHLLEMTPHWKCSIGTPEATAA